MPLIIKITEDALIVTGDAPAAPSVVGSYIRSFTCHAGLKVTPDPAKAKKFKTGAECIRFVTQYCDPNAAEFYGVYNPEKDEEDNTPLARYSVQFLDSQTLEEADV